VIAKSPIVVLKQEKKKIKKADCVGKDLLI